METPEPNCKRFAVADPRVFSPGDFMMIDRVDGISEVAQVQRKIGRVIYLVSPLGNLPQLPNRENKPSDILKIIGTSSVQIDTRWDLSNPKHAEAWQKNEQRRIAERRNQ